MLSWSRYPWGIAVAKRESSLVTAIIKAIKREWPKAYVRKISDRHTRGIPDIVCQVGDGLASACIWIEVKTEDGVLSEIQKVEHQKIWDAGGYVCVATSPEYAHFFIHRILAIIRAGNGHIFE